MSDPISAIVGLVVGGGGVYAAHRLAHVRGQHDDRRVLKREAATALEEALSRLADDLHRGDTNAPVPLHERRLSETLAGWRKAWDRHSRRLPDGAQHIRRSIRFALGERFGLAGASDAIEDGVDYPLAQFDPIWHGHAVNYVTYVRDWIAQWHDQPDAAEKRPPLRFDPWLKDIERHEYDVRHGLISRFDRLLHRFSGPQKERP